MTDLVDDLLRNGISPTGRVMTELADQVARYTAGCLEAVAADRRFFAFEVEVRRKTAPQGLLAARQAGLAKIRGRWGR